MSQSSAVELDAVDRAIIAELQRDARLSVSMIASSVHISRTHAYSRITRLTSLGVLTKFTALVDPVKAGLTSSAYVHLKVRQHAWRELKGELAALPEVVHIALVGGDFDVVLLVRAHNNEGLRNFIFDKLQAMSGVLDTRTTLIFEEIDNR